MQYPQINNFFENVPINHQRQWQKFINSLSEAQKADFAQLCPDLTIKQRRDIFQDTDGLGSEVQNRIVDLKATKKMHIRVAGDDKPFPAISYRNHTYTLFRTLSDWETAAKISSRLKVGYLITQTPKGWVVWVHEQEEA
jgi:hypothetical protein